MLLLLWLPTTALTFPWYSSICCCCCSHSLIACTHHALIYYLFCAVVHVECLFIRVDLAYQSRSFMFGSVPYIAFAVSIQNHEYLPILICPIEQRMIMSHYWIDHLIDWCKTTVSQFLFSTLAMLPTPRLLLSRTSENRQTKLSCAANYMHQTCHQGIWCIHFIWYNYSHF